MRIRRFKGEEELKIDSKGRVSIPAGLRRVLEAQDPDWVEGRCPSLTIVYGDHLDGFLSCYSVETMEEVHEMLDMLPSSSKRAKIMRRNYLGRSVEMTVDDTGRIVLPAKLRQKIGVEPGNSVYFIGNGKTFEIWHPDTFRAQVEELEDDEEDEDFDPEAIFDELRARKIDAKPEAEA